MRELGRGRGSPCKLKSLNFPLLLDKNITYWKILMFLRQVLTKILPAACIQLHNYDLFEKAQLKLSSFKTVSSRIISQNHMPGISLLTKYFIRLLHSPGVDCSTFPSTFIGNPGDGEKSYAAAKILLIFPPSEQSPLIDLNLSLSKVSFLPHQIAIFK